MHRSLLSALSKVGSETEILPIKKFILASEFWTAHRQTHTHTHTHITHTQYLGASST